MKTTITNSTELKNWYEVVIELEQTDWNMAKAKNFATCYQISKNIITVRLLTKDLGNAVELINNLNK